MELEGPIAKIIQEEASKSQSRVQGIIYEFEKAKNIEGKGIKVIELSKKFLMSENQKTLWGIVNRTTVEFDIVLEDTFIETKDISWTFVERFYTFIDQWGWYWLKDLELSKFNSKELQTILNNLPKKDTFRQDTEYIHGLLQQIKAGNEMAKEMGQKYEFHSKHAIPPVIKDWLTKNDVTFFEKDCIDCNCDRKYKWCFLQ